ncbi:DUF7286 family protein [Halosegnis rubeus]|uniref:Uncharacterized protein n=1 Tax=Halosegnis rubeus TaxID=2212850 RepID=A0A5N5UIM2_9EURY|nr:hypothetical protein [Halosegnis rubeus]KAB7518100.1 hypothetical protein DMP03_01680 [Halosegnis rubeus]
MVGVNERARVPFALLGVVLLVGSASIAAGLGGTSPTREPATEAAIEQGRTSLGGTVHDATRTAARNVAASPVVAPANTTLGRVLAATGDPFRAALELRTYLAVRDRLSATTERGVTVDPSLPALRDSADIDAALSRTTVEPVGANATAVRTTVANVTLTAMRDGRVIDRYAVSPTMTVQTPVFALHERTRTYQQRLDSGATEPGLARRATARLYGVAWARGLTQYGGGPIANVVSNQHVAVATNHALLAQQRATFGATDDTGRRAVRVAAARAAGTDLLAATGQSGKQIQELLAGVDAATPGSTLDPVAAANPPITPESALNVSVGEQATTAFDRFVTTDLDAVLAAPYRVTVERRRAVTDSATTTAGRERPTGDNWTLVGTEQTDETTVTDGDATVGSPVNPWHTLATTGRRVAETTRTERRWRRNHTTHTTVETTTQTRRVSIRLVGRHDGGAAPPVGTSPIHERGGAIDGPNLAAVERRAKTRLLGDEQDLDALAARTTSDGTTQTTIRGEQPLELRDWVYRDLVRLRERVANVSVAVERGAVGTYQVNPSDELAGALRARRARLVDRPDEYDGVADRARVAARGAYLDAVITELERRADDRDGVKERLAGLLAARGLSLGRLRSIMAARSQVTTPTSHSISGVGGSYSLDVEGVPAYLTLASVNRTQTDSLREGSVRPLAARNTNIFTVPYGDAADGIVGKLFGGDRVRLRSAARALAAGEELATHETLEADVETAVSRRRRGMRRVLRRAGVGDSRSDRRRIVAAGLGAWETVAERAIAVTENRGPDAVAAVALRRSPGSFDGPADRDDLRRSLRAVATDGRGVPESSVTPHVERARQMVGKLVKQSVGRAANQTTTAVRERLESKTGKLAAVPSGIPVTPVPSQWYATANIWDIEARGGYDRFAVSVRNGGPGRRLTYVRDGSTVVIDWNGDGELERAGTATAVTFAYRTAVVVVVPPGGQGVGDVDGNADERSAGWGER